MNKYVWIYIGVKTPMLDDIIWYSQGVYVFSQNGYNYDTQTRSLTINCMDLTAMLNDTLAGQLTGIKPCLRPGAESAGRWWSYYRKWGSTKYL